MRTLISQLCRCISMQLVWAAFIVMISAGAVMAQINPYLPFDMPSTATLRASPKKVFAHYFTPYPLAINNNPPATDYYTTGYLNPSGESGKHVSYGGWLRERPLVMPVRSEPNWAMLDLQEEVRRAIAIGIDGFTLDVLSSSGTHWTRCLNLMDAANAVDPGFKIVIMPDMEGLTAAEITGVVEGLAAKPAAYRLSDGRLVVSPFNAQNQTAAWWQSWMSTMASRGINVAFVPVFQNWRAYASSYAPISYGFSDWGERTPSANSSTRWVNAAAEAHASVPIWMHPIAPQDVRPKGQVYWESVNTTSFRQSWELGANGKADWVQLITWNDYSEHSEIAPSTGIQHLYYDLNAYYITWFKQGTPPPVLRDCIYYSHRQHSTTAAPDLSQQTAGAFNVAGGEPPANFIEAFVFLKSDAIVEIEINGVRSQQAVAAPRGMFRIPLSTGRPIFRLIRNNQVVASVQSAFPINNTITYQDFVYHGGSSLRAPVTQVPEAYWPKAPVDAVADLIVTSIQPSPATPGPGQAVTFQAVVKNQGTAATPAGLVIGVSFWVDGVQVSWSDTYTNSLAAGASVTLTANGGPGGSSTWTATGGSHSVLAEVDDINRIAESSDSNNSLTATLTVNNLSDLIVTGISWSPTSPTPGQAVTFSATVKNQGTVASPAGTIHGVSFSVDGVQVSWSDTHTSSLAAGASVTLTANGGPSGVSTWSAVAGTHAVSAFFDDMARIPEANEDNNILNTSITVSSVPLPATPTGLTATPGNAQVSLAWNTAANATSYNVKRSTTSGGPYTTIATGVTATSYLNTGLVNGTTYYYVVSSVNTAGQSANSAQASATPAAPLCDLIVTAITWSPAAPASGQAVTFSATIKNQGTAASPAGIVHGISFWVNGTQVGWSDNNSTSLAPGASRTQTVNGGPGGVSTWSATTGVGSVVAWVDDVNRIPNESNENNNTLTNSITVTPLPAPWQTADIGATGVAGSAALTNGVFTIKGSGADIWGTADAFRYVHQSSSGDCSIIARVTAVQNTNPWAKAGVMIRESTTAGSMNASVVVSPTSGIAFQWRSATGGTTTSTVVAGLAAPYWVRLTRTGNSFAAYRSTNGTSWTQIGTAQTVPMATSARLGLAVTSHNNAALCTATIANVTATP